MRVQVFKGAMYRLTDLFTVFSVNRFHGVVKYARASQLTQQPQGCVRCNQDDGQVAVALFQKRDNFSGRHFEILIDDAPVGDVPVSLSVFHSEKFLAMGKTIASIRPNSITPVMLFLNPIINYQMEINSNITSGYFVKGMVFDINPAVFYTVKGNNAIEKYFLSGDSLTLVNTFNITNYCSAPVGIAYYRGSLLVADYSLKRIVAFNASTGSIIPESSYAVPFNPAAIAIEQDNLWISGISDTDNIIAVYNIEKETFVIKPFQTPALYKSLVITDPPCDRFNYLIGVYADSFCFIDKNNGGILKQYKIEGNVLSGVA